jgi:acetyltransferase-like isoleucine patch superfamily enzyme
MQCSDWNAVNFDSDCVVGGFLQFHTFENMMLKVKQTHIRQGCTISSGATVMSGVVIEPGTTVLPLSLVLKEMDLHTAIYHGSPVEPVLGAVTDAEATRRPTSGQRAALVVGPLPGAE